MHEIYNSFMTTFYTGARHKLTQRSDHVARAMVEGKRATFEDMKVKTRKGIVGIEAKEIIADATIRLNVLVDDPDHPRDAPCIAKLVQVYDTAELGKKQQD